MKQNIEKTVEYLLKHETHHLNNLERQIQVWTTILKIATEIKGQTYEEIKDLRKAYEKSRQSSEGGNVRKTAQRHFAIAIAINKGNLPLPAISKFDDKFTAMGDNKS